MAHETDAPLTWRQELFVELYIQHGIGSKAAVLAGFSERTASVIAHELLTEPRFANVQRRLEERKKQRLKKIAIDKDWVLQRLAREGDDPDNSASVRVQALQAVGKFINIGTDVAALVAELQPSERLARIETLLKTAALREQEASEATPAPDEVTPASTEPLQPS